MGERTGNAKGFNRRNQTWHQNRGIRSCRRDAMANLRDYTTNNYCDFLWISDLLELKKNQKNMFQARVTKNNRASFVSFVSVTVFGTIVEIKQLGPKNFLYSVDDGTGVIACKHGKEQFEEIIGIIESEQNDVLNQSLRLTQSFEESYQTDASMEDSIFNEKSIQDDELRIIKSNLLKDLQFMWNDIYESFTNLIDEYEIGDTVLIEGKLYKYFNSNQIYINNIRRMNLSEEIIKVSNKLKDGYDPIVNKSSVLVKDLQHQKRRCSGLMTFDNVHHLNARIPFTRDNVDLPKENVSIPKELIPNNVIPPNLSSIMTFDTFSDISRRIEAIEDVKVGETSG